MERADLLYSGLMFAAVLLSLWTGLLITAAVVTLARKRKVAAATISSKQAHGPEKPTPPRSLSQALP